MFGNRQLLAAAVLVVIAAACGSGGATRRRRPGRFGRPARRRRRPRRSPRARSKALRLVRRPGHRHRRGHRRPRRQRRRLLRPARSRDFTAAGTAGTAAPVENFDDSGNYFCIYATTRGDRRGRVRRPRRRSRSDIPADHRRRRHRGARCHGRSSGSRQGRHRSRRPRWHGRIAVCEGQLCFEIDAPTTPGVRDRLLALARLVVQRSIGLTS